MGRESGHSSILTWHMWHWATVLESGRARRAWPSIARVWPRQISPAPVCRVNMASENGEKRNKPSIKFVGEKFGQRKVPLSVSIRRILDSYPDGQIFKVK